MLVHHSRLPAWPRSTSDDPYFGPYKILSVDGHRITVRCSPRLGGTLVCAAQHLKRYHDPEDLCGEEWELNDDEITALDLQGAASPMEVEGELPDMNAEEMAKEGFYLVKSILPPPLPTGLALPHPVGRVWSRRGHLGALLRVCAIGGMPKLSSGRLPVPEQRW